MTRFNIPISGYLVVAVLIVSTSGLCMAAPAQSGKETAGSIPDAWQKALNSIETGDNADASKYASLLLKLNSGRKWWGYGNIVHDANQIMGIAALREGRIQDADQYLIAAGKTPGSPQMDSFGPNMFLAQQLLDKGQKAAVIQYLDLVARFWAYTSPAELHRIDERKPGFSKQVIKMDAEKMQQIKEWKQQIGAGLKPKLNDSDDYGPI
jgi:hypothetical protein